MKISKENYAGIYKGVEVFVLDEKDYDKFLDTGEYFYAVKGSENYLIRNGKVVGIVSENGMIQLCDAYDYVPKTNVLGSKKMELHNCLNVSIDEVLKRGIEDKIYLELMYKES